MLLFLAQHSNKSCRQPVVAPLLTIMSSWQWASSKLYLLLPTKLKHVLSHVKCDLSDLLLTWLSYFNALFPPNECFICNEKATSWLRIARCSPFHQRKLKKKQRWQLEGENIDVKFTILLHPLQLAPVFGNLCLNQRQLNYSVSELLIAFVSVHLFCSAQNALLV